MKYIIDIGSPATWNAFLNSERNVSGATAKGVANKQIHPGDIFICYLTDLSRWCGVLEVISEPYHADTGLYSTDDPYVMRIGIKPIVCLPPELAIPIKDSKVWPNLSFTKNLPQNSSAWTHRIRRSFGVLSQEDGEFLYGLLLESQSSTVQATVEIPEPATKPADESEEHTPDVRDSIVMQAKVAEIGIKMGLFIWVPANDKVRVLEHIPLSLHDRFLTSLNLAYPQTMLNTVKQIDVLWLDSNDNIVRAFEIEHTTAIYSGLLRMTDLRALQPQFPINFHIVAPDDREAKVLNEIRRPTFKHFNLSMICSSLSYTKVDEIAALPHLQHLSANVIGDYEVKA